MYGIIGIILLLYWRTWKYYKLIDDPVPREGYLVELPRQVPYSFYDERKPILWTATNIITFIGVCSYIYLVWGWKASLLYAVFPLNICGVAWGRTGNYYMTTSLFVVMTHYFLTHGMAFVSVATMYLALYSTVNSIFYPLLALLIPNGFFLLVPLALFLTNPKLRNYMKLRKEKHKELGIKSGFEVHNLANVPKILAYYIFLSFFPSRLGMFHSWGKTKEYFTKSMFWICLVVCLSFFVLGWVIDPFMILWWFMAMGIFCHIQGHYGQFVAERYTVVANVAFCVIVAKVLPYEVILVYASLLFYRSHVYIPSWRHNINLFSQGVTAFPECTENYNNYGLYLLERGRWQEALSPFLLALKYTTGNKYGLHKNVARCYYSIKHYDKAYAHIIEAIKTCPEKEKGELRILSFEINDKVRRGKRLLKQLNEL